MRLDISTSALGEDTDSFRVSYVSDEAEKARRVTERLASLYIEQNLKDRENQADSTSQFLDTQLEQAKARLIEQEKKLEQYRKSHAGQMPSQLQGNLLAIQTASQQVQTINESTNRAQERRLLVERQIADTQALSVPVPATVEGATPVGYGATTRDGTRTSGFDPAALHAESSGGREPGADDRRPGHQVGKRNTSRSVAEQKKH